MKDSLMELSILMFWKFSDAMLDFMGILDLEKTLHAGLAHVQTPKIQVIHLLLNVHWIHTLRM